MTHLQVALSGARATPAACDPATLAVLTAVEEAAEKHLDAIRSH